ncbi:TfoX/Sxy family DNA transformation protein [Rhodoferax sp.]|uniref:TfoX/Sxy family DNA transformation protein n=1 Tax=Rhodoferax sp. TaxID=50421 RepID=UPI00271B4214|nr:TfoX/Sxy family DNA transformation protein [Rhodoferax sp.]MDO8318740.1 TfoX/Sxy family DNA transformation protein [Rhodoferax sp.]MDP2677692.1 TfoX/Sxy family DNA transformation protein [Rhodoferax sp.]
MATSQSTIDFLLDQLGDCGPVSARKMFGEYCLYFLGKPIGLVCDNQLFLKPTTAVRALMHEPLDGVPYPKARPHLLVSADLWDDRQSLCQWVRATYDALLEVPPSKPHKADKPAVKRVPGAAPALTELVNLGPKSQQMLQTAGICTLAQLRKLGSVAAYVKVKNTGLPASLNLLWALEGALTGLSWQVIAREHRTSLLLALEQLQEMDARSRRGEPQTRFVASK